jgi:dihydrofolate synthase/folylpolyglutamate synthase
VNYFEAMSYIESFSKLGGRVTNLSRMKRICRALGNPEERLLFVHVAGTNGKGSTVRMIANSLRLAGYRTGEFTSPYIRVWNDRIRCDGVSITDDELAAIVTEIKPIFDNAPDKYSQFELATVIAFIYFAAKKCDVVLLETGIGGRLDCTNVIENTLVSVITSISLDHMAILGSTLTEIAAEKAGIIKEKRPVVLSAGQKSEVFRTVYLAASRQKAEFITPDTEKLKIITKSFPENKFKYKGTPYELKMVGRHQIENALTAIETLTLLRELGFPGIKPAHIIEGLRTAAIPSRCQVISQSPYILLDGAHNPDGMRCLADFVRDLPHSPKIMITAMSGEKDYENTLSMITRHIDFAYCIDGIFPGSVDARLLAEQFNRAACVSVTDAMSLAAAAAGPNGAVIIAGSLYLASALQKYIKA